MSNAAMKAEYTEDPFNIPEKLYAYYMANGISAAEAVSLRETFVKSLVQDGFVEQNISEGRDKKVYRELMDLLQGFGFDHSYSVEKKRRLLREIADSVASRLDKGPQATVNPEEAENVRAFWNRVNANAKNGSYYVSGPGSYYNRPRYTIKNEEFADPNNNGTYEGGGKRKTRRRNRRNRKSYRRRH
jgi:hypothetical protein